jgi:thiosulfate dehydrogenase
MNPMTKKLMLAGIPTGTQPLKESQIPEDTSRYEKPLRDATVEGAGSGGGGGGNSGNATSTSTPSPESTPTPTSTTNPTQSALADAMTGSEAESGG